MNSVAELLVVVYNDRRNAYEGSRDAFTKVEVADKEAIKQTIQDQFNGPLAKHVGCVVVKFDDKIWLCERDTVNPKKIYTRHEITYHPLAQHFTI